MVDIDFRIKGALVGEFLTAVKAMRQQRNNSAWLFLDRLRLDDRLIVYDDDSAAWGDDREFALFLARYAEEGFLRFVGEDGKRWGYYFDGAGDVYPLTYLESIAGTPLAAAQTG